MKIHYFNCVSMSPWWPRWHLGGVCLLAEIKRELERLIES